MATDASLSRRECLGTGARSLIAATALSSLLPHWPRAVRAQPPLPTVPWAQTDDLFDQRTLTAIDRGLAFLAANQLPTGEQPGRMGGNVAVVSFTGLAFLAAANLPGRGPLGEALQSALEYVAGSSTDSGFIIRRDVSRGAMYGHGFATLFLAEAIGVTLRRDLDAKLRAAIQVIIAAQHPSGGWRYTPEPEDADLSVTVGQVMALRAARNAGVYVPAETIDQAIDYIRRSQNPDGGFIYQLAGGESRFPLTAGAIVALQNAGRYEADELTTAYAYLQQHFAENLSPRETNYFFYAHYYSVQALWQRGGQPFERWYQALRDVLLNTQAADGGWNDYIGRAYATAMACLILSAPRTSLPIFQR